VCVLLSTFRPLVPIAFLSVARLFNLLKMAIAIARADNLLQLLFDELGINFSSTFREINTSKDDNLDVFCANQKRPLFDITFKREADGKTMVIKDWRFAFGEDSPVDLPPTAYDVLTSDKHLKVELQIYKNHKPVLEDAIEQFKIFSFFLVCFT
jgi:hypothetical protein